jgi:uncharacterized protein YdeI (YjbR/CyaY-like superfamily)
MSGLWQLSALCGLDRAGDATKWRKEFEKLRMIVLDCGLTEELSYLLYLSAPKQSKTRESRIEKCMPLIFDGMGLNDQ